MQNIRLVEKVLRAQVAVSLCEGMVLGHLVVVSRILHEAHFSVDSIYHTVRLVCRSLCRCIERESSLSGMWVTVVYLLWVPLHKLATDEAGSFLRELFTSCPDLSM